MARTRSYVTRNLVRRCRAAGPAYNTRGVFSRRLIQQCDLERLTDQAPAPPKPDLAPIRDVIAEQLQIIRRSRDFDREQHIVAMLLFLTSKVDVLRTNQVQLNAYRRIAELYSRESLFAFAAAYDFIVASA
jgi:hypothetical protein